MPASNNNNDEYLVLKLLEESMAESSIEGMHGIFKRQRGSAIRILNKKLIVKNQDQFECKKNCCPCYCRPQLLLRERFSGAAIFAIFSIKPDGLNCILCDRKIRHERLNEHFDNECIVFKVSQVIYDKLNV